VRRIAWDAEKKIKLTLLKESPLGADIFKHIRDREGIRKTRGHYGEKNQKENNQTEKWRHDEKNVGGLTN